MADLSEDIQCKENGVNILKSIDEEPYQMGTVREPLAEGTEGAPHLGPERPRVYSDLSPEEKDQYNADIRATNILLQGLPKEIYTLINHYTDAKDIWDNFAKLINDIRNIKMTMSRMQLNSKFMNNMLPEWGRFVTDVKLNRGLRDSNYDQLAHRKELHLTKATTELRILQRQDVADAGSRERSSFGRRAAIADDCDAFDSDVDEAPTAQTMFMANLSSADPVTDEAGPSYDLDILSEYVKDNEVLVVHSDVSSVPNDAFMMIYNDMCEPHAQFVSNPSRNTIVENSLTAELAIYKEQVELRYPKIAEITRKKMNDKMKDPECVTRKGIQKALTKEVKEIKDVFEELEAEVAQNVIDRKHDAIEWKNLLIENDNLIAECLFKEVFFVATNSELNEAKFTEMHVANTIVEARCLKLEAELANLRDKSHHANQEELINHFSKLE
nr:hypothetical protein [Tanacetum cinerariifolium]